jgi:ABC-2 type transport system permease protein
MNAAMLWALVRKDIGLYFKNRLFAFITVIGLIIYVVMFYLMPATVDESLELAWAGPVLPGMVVDEMREEGLILTIYESDAALQEAVLSGEQPAGISMPEDFQQRLLQGEKPRVAVYYGAVLPEEYRSAYSLLLEEIGYSMTGQPLNIEAEEVVLGPDMAGQQVPPRNRMLPVLVTFVLAIEIMGMAALFTNEVETGTLRALLVTRLNRSGLFLAKGATGMLMAFTQVMFLLVLTGGLRSEPLLVVTALLLGALLVTGFSFIIAAAGRDLMSVMGWGMLVMIFLAIPSFNILLPGLASNWIRIIPSYYLLDVLYQTMNFGAGWSQASSNLLALTAYAAAVVGLGVLAMQWRLR